MPIRSRLSAALIICMLGAGAAVHAQDAEVRPAFSLATSHVFNTRESPSITLTHRQVDHLDFRVYRVNDAFAFFGKLRDPHQLGSEEPLVPEEQSWLERIAAWKASLRGDMRGFARRQVSSTYRADRNARLDRDEVVLRQTLNVNTFAQVPLLNPSALVTSWRELLPRVRDAEYRRIPLDLTSAGVYVVEAVSAPLRAYTVVVVSDVGLVTKTAPGELLVFAANRFSGDPLPNCRVRVITSVADHATVTNGTTGADGTYQTDVTASSPDQLVVLADCAGQTAATDPGAYTIVEPSRELLGYTYTDRPVYRPGHVVRFKSVLRWREKGAVVPFGQDRVEVSISDGNDKVLLRDTKRVDAFGAVSGSFTIPAAASLGYYVVRVASGDDTASGAFEVQEYRKPEFDVAVRASDRHQLQGKSTAITVTSRYYFGQPVAGGVVRYVVQRQGYYSPLRYEESGEDDESDGDYGGGDEIHSGTARLNDQGTAEIQFPLEIDDGGRDYTARFEARVIDASGREVSGAASVVATHGRFMVFARPERYVYGPGQPGRINIRAVDYDGNAQSGVSVHAVFERVDYRNGYDQPNVTLLQEGDVVTGPDGRAQWPIAVPQEPDSYRVRVSAQADDRQVSDQASIWVPGHREDADEADQFLELIADRRTYQPGDTAQLLTRGAEFEASVLVTKESQNVSSHQVLEVRSNEAIPVPITEEDIGDIYVSIAFLKDDRLYRAERRLSIPALRRQLTITADTDRPVVRPGEPGTFTLHVTDAAGAPVRAQLSVGLVDEAIYGVRPDTTPNPLRFFYRREYNMVGTSFSREYPFVGYSSTEQLLLAKRRRPLTLADFKADRPDRPRVRKDFPDTVFWVADVTTDTNGNAQVKVEYPDSLTTWRLTVRGVTVATDVGAALARTVSTKDLILRVIAPRFLTEGDSVAIPTIVHNYLPSAKTVGVSLSADGLAATNTTQADSPRSVQVAQNGQQRVDWAFTAPSVGRATVTSQATSDVAGDAVQVSLPVLPAGLQRNTGTSGSIVEPGQRSIELTVPPTANRSGRSVRVALAPSLAGTMLGALDYLTSFPWGCTEQTLSSFVPNLVVLRAMSEMQIAPTERLQSLDRQVSDGLKRLYDYQHDDGGWGWWKTDQNHPFMTAYAVDGLTQARENGVSVEEWRIGNGTEALVQLYQKYPRAVPDLKAYVAYVIARAGRTTEESFGLTAALDDLWSARARMTASGQAFLLMTLDQRKDARAAELAASLLASARTTGDVAWWPVETDPLLEDFGDTSVEGTSLVLRALSARDPNQPVLERAARWLVLNRTSGYWVSTKQTALALQGLLAFMRARGETPAPVTADVFVNDTRIGRQSFDAASLASPNPVLVEGPAGDGVNTVRIEKQGAGALYFDASVRYYDKPAAESRTGSRTLALVRKYSTLVPVQVRERTVYRERPFNGTAKAGDIILVRLTAAGSPDWRYLMLEDPIPAGAEQVENEDGYDLEQRMNWFWGSQREFRDDRTTFFLSDFTRGRYEFSYMLKATQPGTFSAMPARISPMYVPNVSASSEVATVTVSAEGVK